MNRCYRYDDAANIKGAKRSVAKQLSRENLAVIYGHALNMAAEDAIRHCEVM